MLGQVISHYEVVGKLGAGGMGEVFEAQDTLLHRIVALKVLPANKVADPERRARFLIEARAASSLNHPYIITIHDVVTTPEGAFCIVMERVRGRSLTEAIPPGGLPADEVLRFAIQIAEALSTAHAAGIAHRDLKPGNVMVTERGDIKVLDFGLAKLLPTAGSGADPTVSSDGTQFGAVLGTPDYMSPEQAKGEFIDHRTDIFSFGMLLFEMLTGQRAFQGSNRIATLHALVSDPSPRVSAVRPGLASSFDIVVERLLVKERDGRYQSFGDVLSDLRNIQSGGSVHQVAQPASAPSPRFSGRRTAYLGVGSIVVAAAVAFTVFGWPGRSTSPAVGAAAIDEPLPVTASDFVSQGERLLRRYDREGHIDGATRAYESALQKQPEYAPAFAGLAMANWRRFRETRDRTYLRHAEGNARQAVEKDSLLADGHAALGLSLTALGQVDEAGKAFADGLRLDPTNADALRGLGDLSARAHAFEDAERHYRAAIAARPEDPELPSVLGGLYYRLGRADDAKREFERTIALAEDYHIGHKNLGAVLHMQGEFAAAARSLQRAIELRPEASVYTNLGTLYYYQGLYTEAVAALEKSISLRANDYRTWGNMGDALRRISSAGARAREAYQRAAQLAATELETAPTADTRALRALYLARADAADEARRELARMDHDELAAETLYVLALVREALGDRAEAIETLRLAIAAGHSVAELERDPELIQLRADPAYHRMMLKGSPAPR